MYYVGIYNMCTTAHDKSYLIIIIKTRYWCLVIYLPIYYNYIQILIIKKIWIDNEYNIILVF